MKLRRVNRGQARVDMLARTAALELDLGVGSWQDTIRQMNELISQLEDSRREARSAEDELLRHLRLRVSRLESVIHHRETEYDALQERYCDLQDKLNQSEL